jgi:type III restriction enzyme
MKIKFNPNMQYQLDAIQSTIDIFTGQKKNDEVSYDITEASKIVISNELSITHDDILENVRFVQKRNEIEPSDELNGLNFSIDMETGTGKTYVYLRTIFELNKKYGFKKFIIVVPSVAIREGVLKTLQMTKEHFKEHFGNIPFHSFVYEGKKLSDVRTFSVSNQIEIMIMNIDSFNKESNIFNRYDDAIQGIPKEFVNAVKPILILDEPQNMESDKSKASLASLNPLLTLRYSATHRDLYNLIFKFGAVKAYNEGMVKQIEVASVYEDKDYNGVYIKLLDIGSQKNSIWAQVEIYQKNKSGEKIDKKKIKISKSGSGIKKNFDLFEASGKLGSYTGFLVDTIDLTHNYLSFTNGIKIEKGHAVGGYTKEIMRTQIRETIIEHFDKEKVLSAKGIKVLSLFFIDKVDNYLENDGYIRQYFIEEFAKLKSSNEYKEQLKDIEVNDIHNGYFSKGKETITPFEIIGKQKTNKKAEEDTYSLIMKDKERLLSFSEPLRFIFSHSALREGWDNPNVFNICTLRENDTGSIIKKRQEIGRGLRICVNQDGERNYDRHINKLTVIANERYEAYAKNLQSEYEAEGIIEAPPTKNKRKKKTVSLRKGYRLDENFKELWDKIKHRTKYSVKFDTDDLIDRCVDELNKHLFLASEGSIGVDRVRVVITDEGIETTITKIKNPEILENKFVYVPDIITALQKETGLTRSSIVKILTRVELLDDIFKNPEEFLINLTSIIKYIMSRTLIENIQYEKTGDYYRASSCVDKQDKDCFLESFEAYEDSLVPLSEPSKGIYDYIQTDSDVEKEFAEILEAREDIKLFVKLPFWFKIDTPIGTYNPDWAVVKQNGEKVYMVRETKGTTLEGGLRGDEKDKISCGGIHFKELNVDYDVAVKGRNI